MKWYTYKIDHIERLTKDSVRLDLLPKDGGPFFNFKSGQYLTFLHQHQGSEIRRSYSICSSQSDDRLSVGIKEVEGGIFSTFANRNLAIGDLVTISEPTGNFLNPSIKEENLDYVFFAAGSGITPILSHIKSILDSSQRSTVTLFYGNKNVRSIMFLEELESIKNQYTSRLSMYHVLSRQVQDSDLFNGRIDAAKISDWNMLFDIHNTHQFFLCGPESMILSVQDELKNQGVDSSKIHFELFTSGLANEARKQRKASVSQDDAYQIKLILDGKEMNFDFTSDDDNVLDKALQEGADLPYACKGGVCCTCKAKLEEGDVDMYVNYGLEPDEIEKGFILTCQAYPKTKHITVNFDEV